MMRLIFLSLFLLPFWPMSQTVCTPESSDRLENILARLSGTALSDSPINSLAVEIGGWFLETPYVEKTLESTAGELLVVNMIGLDCTTFLESVVTLARLAKQGKLEFPDYEHELEFLRYRDGKRDEYPSRLHYFSDWIYQNQQKGIIKDITKNIGGKAYQNQPSFMSSNPKFYAQLSNQEYVEQIRAAEAAIALRDYHYIAKDDVRRLEGNIKAGDLIAITTSIPNLDIVHVGFAVERGGRIHLLHASSSSMKVEISEKPLHEYLQAQKSIA